PNEGAFAALARHYRKAAPITSAVVAGSGQDEAEMPALRPFVAGEYIDNGDGSYSTERTVTIQDKNGNWVNVPSLWKDSEGNTVDFGDGEDAIAKAHQEYEAGGGKRFRRFKSVEDAVAAA